jgi:hypothetical protein
MAIVKRTTKGSALTHAELDGNFDDLDGRVTSAASLAAGRQPTLGLANAAELNTLLSLLSVNEQTGTTYTLVLDDAGRCVNRTNASANTTTVPPNSSVAFPIGTVIQVSQGGAGICTISPGAGVTFIKPSTRTYATSAQYETASLHKRGTDTWLVVAS